MGTFFMIIQFIVCIALIVAVVLQESKGEGLGSIGGGSRMFFSQRKGNEEILSTATTYLAVGFMVLSVVLSVWF
jgi:preprotein translocase subunit SecG